MEMSDSVNPLENDTNYLVNEKHRKFSKLRIYLAAGTAHLTLFSIAAAWSLSTCYRLELVFTHREKDNFIEINHVVQLVFIVLGFLIGTFSAGPFVDHFGYKRAVHIVHSNCVKALILTWIQYRTIQGVRYGTYFDSYFLLTLIAGFISCAATAWSLVINLKYIAAIGLPNNRGVLAISAPIMLAFGTQAGLGVMFGSIFFRILSITILVAAIIGIYCFFPESPYYLLTRNNHEEAMKSLIILRGVSSVEIQHEMNAIQQTVERCRQSRATWCDLFRKPSNRKALLLLTTLFVLSNALNIKANVNIHDRDFSNSMEWYLFLHALPSILSLLTAASLLKVMGARVLLMSTSLGVLVCQAILGLIFHFGWESFYPRFLPATGILYMTLANIGICSVPLAMSTDMFPPDIWTKALTASVFLSWCIQNVPPLPYFFLAPFGQDTLQNMFYASTIANVLCVLFVFFYVKSNK